MTVSEEAFGPSESLGSRIRRLRTARGFRQVDLAGPGLSRPAISLIERNKISPSRKVLDLLAKRLEVPVSALVNGSIEEWDVLNEAIHFAEKVSNGKDSELALNAWTVVERLAGLWGFLQVARRAKIQRAFMCEIADLPSALPLLIEHLVAGDLDDDARYRVVTALAGVLRKRGAYHEARAFYHSASQLTLKADNRWLRSTINHGSAPILDGDTASARNLFDDAANIANESGEGRLEAWALLGYLTACFEDGIIEGTERMVNRAALLADNLEDPALKNAVLHNRVVHLRLIDHADDAAAIWPRAIGGAASADDRARLWEEKAWIVKARVSESMAAIRLGFEEEPSSMGQSRLLLVAARILYEHDRVKEAQEVLVSAHGILACRSSSQAMAIESLYESWFPHDSGPITWHSRDWPI